jgi:biopolymer transport protein ExbD
MAKKKKRPPFRGDNKPMKGDMTPMIDVTFQLLIFFMLTIKFKTLEGKLAAYLPKDVGVNTTEAIPKEKTEIKLKVDREGNKLEPLSDRPWGGEGPYRYDSTREIVYSIGPKSTKSLDEVKRRLRDLYNQDPERPATIDPFPGTVYDDVIRVLDVAIEAGYRDITFVGDRSGAAIPK